MSLAGLLDGKRMATKFQDKVYELTKKVPKGKVVTYKGIAQAIGTRAYRAVGNALNKNPYAPRVPCHRVVNSNGKIGGYAKGSKKKAALLRSEGILINGNKLDLERFLYNLNK